MQETDVLLHESGAPPIHTPIKVLQELPPEVKKRMYVVHTSALPEECDLRVAPTGTAGTIRLDNIYSSPIGIDIELEEVQGLRKGVKDLPREDSLDFFCCFKRNSGKVNEEAKTRTKSKERKNQKIKVNETQECTSESTSSRDKITSETFRNIEQNGKDILLVAQRPTCVSDAWFMLNLLSAIPFFSR